MTLFFDLNFERQTLDFSKINIFPSLNLQTYSQKNEIIYAQELVKRKIKKRKKETHT